MRQKIDRIQSSIAKSTVEDVFSPFSGTFFGMLPKREKMF
jgi:hypothetical protein